VTGAQSRRDGLTVLAGRGYFSGEEVVACEAAGITPIVPKPLTSGEKADGRSGNQDFIYQPLPLPSRRTTDLALHHCRERTETEPILVQEERHPAQ
jgi:hypothetical protein